MCMITVGAKQIEPPPAFTVPVDQLFTAGANILFEGSSWFPLQYGAALEAVRVTRIFAVIERTESALLVDQSHTQCCWCSDQILCKCPTNIIREALFALQPTSVCIVFNLCSIVCPPAIIPTFLGNRKERRLPPNIKSIKAHGVELGGLQQTIQPPPYDSTKELSRNAVSVKDSRACGSMNRSWNSAVSAAAVHTRSALSFAATLQKNQRNPRLV